MQGVSPVPVFYGKEKMNCFMDLLTKYTDEIIAVATCIGVLIATIAIFVPYFVKM